MDNETTAISANKFRALEVEWVIESPHIRQADGTFREISLPKVSLVSPGTTFHSRARIINLDAQTALNLLDWLWQRKETLEDLAKSKP